MVKTTLTIDGMACNMCESHVNDVIRNHFSVKKVSSNHKKGECEIVSENSLPLDEIKEAFHGSGYEVLEVHEEEYKKRGLFG